MCSTPPPAAADCQICSPSRTRLRAADASYAKNRASFALSSDGYLLCQSALHGLTPAAQSMYVGPFETPSVAELRERLQAAAGNAGNHDAGTGDGLRFQHLADPVGVQSLIADPRNADAVFQVHTHTHTHTHTIYDVYIHTVQCMYIRMYVYTYVYMYVYTHTHTHTHTCIYINSRRRRNSIVLRWSGLV